MNGKQYYATDYGKYKEETNQDVYVITERGDRLDTIAHQFYGSVFDKRSGRRADGVGHCSSVRWL